MALAFFDILVSQQAKNFPICVLPGIANAAGSGAGSSVTTTVTAGLSDQFGNGKLPNSYAVQITCNQAAFAAVINKTNSSFQVVLTPTLGSVTLSAGAFDALIFA